MEELFNSLRQHANAPVSMDLIKSKTPKELISATTIYGESLLVIAAQVNATQIVKYLLEIGVYKNQLDSRGGTALMRAALAKSTETIDILLDCCVDPRLVSSFSGKKAHQMIDYPRLTEYANKFEGLLSNPFFNYAYRQAYKFRYSLANLSGHAPVRDMTTHPLLKGVTDWTDKLDLIKQMEGEYERYLRGDVKNPNGCLYCNIECKTFCKGCKKVPVCAKCTASDTPLLKIAKVIHVNNCKTGIFG